MRGGWGFRGVLWRASARGRRRIRCRRPEVAAWQGFRWSSRLCRRSPTRPAGRSNRLPGSAETRRTRCNVQEASVVLFSLGFWLVCIDSQHEGPRICAGTRACRDYSSQIVWCFSSVSSGFRLLASGPGALPRERARDENKNELTTSSSSAPRARRP